MLFLSSRENETQCVGRRFGFRQEHGQSIRGHKWKECVSTDAGGWIDVVVGDCQFSSSCFNILNEAGSKLYSHTVYLQTCSWSESLPFVCAHSCRHILVHTWTTCIFFLCLSKPCLGFRVQLRLHLLGWAFPHPYCLKSSFTLSALPEITVQMHYLAPVI